MMKIGPMTKGQRLYTLYNTIGQRGDTWVVKVETVQANGLFEEALYQFWTFKAAYHFVKAKQDEKI